MVDAKPGGGEFLRTYWATGPGSALARWGVAGDFERCRVEVQAAVTKGGNAPLSDRVLSGFCANLHKRVTGFAPGKAPGEQVGKG